MKVKGNKWLLPFAKKVIIEDQNSDTGGNRSAHFEWSLWIEGIKEEINEIMEPILVDKVIC